MPKGVYPRTEKHREIYRTAQHNLKHNYMLGKKHSTNTKKKMSLTRTGRKYSPQHCQNISNSLAGRIRSKAERLAIGKGRTGCRVSEIGRLKISKALTGRKMPIGFRIKMKNIALHNWENPVYVAKVLGRTSPNKKELILQSILDRHYPNEWKYTGNGRFIIGRMCPDFININGKKQVIELYGIYWHRNDNPEDRVRDFRKYGYDCLVVWENELEDTIGILRKLQLFIEGKEKPIVDGETGKRVLEIALAAKQSAKENKIIEL